MLSGFGLLVQFAAVFSLTKSWSVGYKIGYALGQVLGVGLPTVLVCGALYFIYNKFIK